MTLEQLRIFVAVAEREHMSQAAAALNLTQSAVSAAIASLEERHNIKLFDRIGRGISLTEAGRILLTQARIVLASAATAERALDDLAGLNRGTLTLAASQTVANYWLPPRMHQFRIAHPGVALQLTIGNTESVATAVKEQVADLGFVEQEVDDPALAMQAVAIDELVIVASPTIAAKFQGTPENSQLLAAPWVFRESGSGTRARLVSALRDQGIDPETLQIILELPSNEAVRAAVEDGAGIAALSRQVVASALNNGTLKFFSIPLPSRRFILLRHRERSASHTERAFSRFLGTEQVE